MKNEFYIVLGSDNSVKYFPDNEPTNFTFRLPYQIQLQGEWKVALVEIQYPETILHIQRFSNDNSIVIDTSENLEYLGPEYNDF